MDEVDLFSKPFFENASDGLLNYLFQEDGVPADVQMYDPLQSGNLNFDGHDSDVFTDASTVSTQPTSDFVPSNCMLRLL